MEDTIIKIKRSTHWALLKLKVDKHYKSFDELINKELKIEVIKVEGCNILPS